MVGVLFCALTNYLGTSLDYYSNFNRGVLPLVNMVVSLGVIAFGLGAAILVLASRRWRPGSSGRVWSQVMTLLFAVILAVNLGKIGYSNGLYKDITAEQLSSLSPGSYGLIRELKSPVTITAFISAKLPTELLLKGKEVEDKLSAIGRANSQVSVKIRRPQDEFDEAGEARRPRLRHQAPSGAEVDEATGREPVDIFLGCSITCAGNTQVIDYFDPGLSVEYELMRAVSSVLQDKKPTLGIAQTDLSMNGGFDMSGGMMGGGMIPQWEVVKEWAKQYKVQEVNLDSDVDPEVGVLVVAQPSSLTQPQIEHLHHYIFSGRPTLILEDPVFVSSRKASLIPSQPKQPVNPYAGGEEQGGPKKGDIKPLWHALGLDYDEDQLVASEYDPSHYFHGNKMPNTILWTDRPRRPRARPPTPAMQGINTLLFFFAGQLRPRATSTPGSPSIPW